MGSDQLEVIVDLKRPKQEESFCYAVQLLSTNILIKSLQATIELGIFDIIAKAGEGAKLSALEIVARLPTNNPDAVVMVDRILRMLAGHSVLTCSVVADNQRVYSHNNVSKCFVTHEDGVSLGSLISLLDDKVYSDSWSQLKGAVLEGGIPFNRLHGMNSFEYTALDSRFNKVFNRAMQSMTTMIAKQTIESYKGFENLKQLVDVGGGLGVTLKEITSTYPHIKGINFDLPHVVERAPSYPGVENVGGDMFESVPSGDAIFMKIINDRETGRSRGFVTFSNEKVMRDAIEGMNGQDLDGRNITVNEAKSHGSGGGGNSGYSQGGAICGGIIVNGPVPGYWPPYYLILAPPAEVEVEATEVVVATAAKAVAAVMREVDTEARVVVDTEADVKVVVPSRGSGGGAAEGNWRS